MSQFIANTTYFLQEGRENLDACLRVCFQAAKQQNIGTLVIFTAEGEGVRKALDEYISQAEYAGIGIVAVSFPAGKMIKGPDGSPMAIQISSENKVLFAKEEIPVVTAHFPFDGLKGSQPESPVLARDLRLIADSLNLFSGSMSLCVQAVTLACDAGHIEIGEHVIAMTADTAILATATVTRNMLSDLVIREVLCKPAIMTIARNEGVPERPEKKLLDSTAKPAPKGLSKGKKNSKSHKKSN